MHWPSMVGPTWACAKLEHMVHVILTGCTESDIRCLLLISNHLLSGSLQDDKDEIGLSFSSVLCTQTNMHLATRPFPYSNLLLKIWNRIKPK